jgi:hypothetical protein
MKMNNEWGKLNQQFHHHVENYNNEKTVDRYVKDNNSNKYISEKKLETYETVN